MEFVIVNLCVLRSVILINLIMYTASYLQIQQKELRTLYLSVLESLTKIGRIVCVSYTYLKHSYAFIHFSIMFIATFFTLYY